MIRFDVAGFRSNVTAWTVNSTQKTAEAGKQTKINDHNEMKQFDVRLK